MLSSKILLIERQQKSTEFCLKSKIMLLDWADFMTVRRIDEKSLDSSVSPNTQPNCNLV